VSGRAQSGGARYRARGWLRHGARLLSPIAATASGVALERDSDLRLERLRQAARDRARERLRPTRPRMRALAVSPGGRVRWREAPVPRLPGPDGAIVHPIAVATCDLDRALALGQTPFALPLHLGHECVAEVLAAGERVTTVSPGQRVVVPFQISCGTCPPCRNGLTANCASVPPLSMYGFGVGGGHWGGALSDELAVPYADAMLVALPDAIEPATAASVADNVSDGYRHVAPYLPEILGREPDAEILIIAALRPHAIYSPSVPLYAGIAAKALGARHVRFVDARPGVREHAERLGLTALAPSELKGVPPAPLVVEANGTPKGLSAALSATAPDGICSSIGGLHRTARIPTGLLYARNATYHVGRTHARTVIPAVLELVLDGRLRPQDVTTSLARIDDAPAAIRAHISADSTKTVLVAD
jgi:alcohol dehydrogenase